jgi:hypothetical protein
MNDDFKEELKDCYAEIGKLKADIKRAITIFEDGNHLECHRFLCELVYGKQK